MYSWKGIGQEGGGTPLLRGWIQKAWHTLPMCKINAVARVHQRRQNPIQVFTGKLVAVYSLLGQKMYTF